MSHVTARNVNPEAGDHAISASPALRAAAEAASRRSWREFPYYPKRYGERGYRFSLSDTGWITTLFRVPATEAMAQIRWLTHLLAARGMPTYLMERHLDHLHAELTKAALLPSEDFSVLERGVLSLRERRVAIMPEERSRALAHAFEVRVQESAARVSNMGIILVSAIIDEAAGVENPVENLETWATDPARFDGVWIAAVREALEAARAATPSLATA